MLLLKKRETTSVVLFLICFTLLFLHAVKATRKEKLVEIQVSSAQKTILVTIEGALENPGRYQFKKGIKIEEILQSIELLPEADISKLTLSQSLKKSRKLRIPYRKKSRSHKY